MPRLDADLEKILLSRDEHGRRRLDDDQILVVAALAIFGRRGEDASSLTPQESEALRRLSTRAGASNATNAAEAEQKIAAFMTAHPLPPDVERQLLNRMREAVQTGELTTMASRKAVQALLGGNAPPSVLQTNKPRPAGAVAAGPLARVLLNQKPGSSKP